MWPMEVGEVRPVVKKDLLDLEEQVKQLEMEA